MKLWLPVCLLLSINAQAQTVYENYQVEKPAEPQGGPTMMQLFLRSNLNVPVKARAARIAGRVFVSGIVEPDGKITGVTVVRGLRPDCDREAVRVFELFNAWVPALKDGQRVRQRVSYPIALAPGPICYFQNGSLFHYFNQDGLTVADTAATVVYRQVTPVDTLTGIPNGDRIIYQREGAKWRELSRFRPVRTLVPVQEKDPAKKHTQLVFLDPQGKWSQTLYLFHPNGTLENQTAYANGLPTGDEQQYAPTGLLIATEEREETSLGVVELKGRLTPQRVVASQTRRTTWYLNGQLKSVELQPARQPDMPANLPKLLNQWDSTGTILVSDGEGNAVYSRLVYSRLDSNRPTLFVESGPIHDGLKDGTWTGYYADSSYRCEEIYEAGIFKSGKATLTDNREFIYQEVEQQPEPVGGMRALGDYLGQTLRYPADAQRSRVQGRVLVSFVVNQDGSIAEVSVVKGIGYGCDEEAVRVVRQMPLWKPGVQRGEPVRVKFMMPINFTLR